MRSHDTVSKVAYVSNFTYVSKCVHVNGALAKIYLRAQEIRMNLLCSNLKIRLHISKVFIKCGNLDYINTKCLILDSLADIVA